MLWNIFIFHQKAQSSTNNQGSINDFCVNLFSLWNNVFGSEVSVEEDYLRVVSFGIIRLEGVFFLSGRIKSACPGASLGNVKLMYF